MAAGNPRAAHILVTDDDPSISRMLRYFLQAEGYRVTQAGDGRAALAAVAAEPPDLILLDLEMPRLGGFEVCRQLKEEPDTCLVPILILTGHAASEARLQAWELGADDFLYKPFQPVEVLARCRSLLRKKRLFDACDPAEAVVFAFARAVEAKSAYTRGHSDRVTAYALALADCVGIGEHEREVLRRGALLHDLGKMSIPDAVLDKSGPLTSEDYELVKQHPVQGARILESLRSLRELLPLVRWHHERLDGHGYPDGLMGDAIPLLVRILSVADVYDALASARPYRRALPHGQCLETLRSNAENGGLDPELVRLFAAHSPAPRAIAGAGQGTIGPRPRSTPATFRHHPQHVGDAGSQHALAAVVPGLVLAPAVVDRSDGQRTQAAVD
jgi:putative two-component system response regulator